MGANATSPAAGVDGLLSEPTLGAAFLRASESDSDRPALAQFGSGRTLALGDWAYQSTQVAAGLRALGVAPGDRVALLLATCLDFHVVDMGAVLAGAAPFSLYLTSPVEQLAPCIENAQPRVLITDAAHAEIARELAATCPVIEQLVVIDARGGDPNELSLEQLRGLGPPGFDPWALAARVGPDDLCSLLYTSGTSGPPKGVCYVHRALMTTMTSIRERVPVSPGGRTLSYLPMAHIAERLFSHYAAFIFGYSVTALGDMTALVDALREVRPTRFFGVPRTWEKLLAAIHAQIDAGDDAPARHEALRRSLERVRSEQAGAAIDASLQATGVDDERLLSGLAAHIGLEDVEWACIAGAPADQTMVEAFHALGVRVNELYGMSETIMTTMAAPDRIKIGWAGPPLPGVGLRLAGDGEILIAGPTVTPGYFRDTERTREAIDADGWMHSGDIGELDEDGYLRVIDRKKALIINSSGKNMSPAAIEQAIRSADSLLGQVVVIGDRRPYNVALIVLDPDALAAFCHGHDLPDAPLEQLAADPRIQAAIDAAVTRGNTRLARVEQVRRHVVLDHVWEPAGFALTATAKLKRGQIEEHYGSLIDGLYR